MTSLRPQLAAGAAAMQIADSAVATWTAIDSALSPVIGHRGSAALYKRSVHMARAAFPWLTAAYEGAATPRDFTALHSALAGQTSEQAAAGQAAVLQTFHDLLTDLIGRSLTQRLLQAVWEPPSSGTSAGDASR
ncbi:MAG: hypothetical protein ABIR26_02565 [Ramlibacter sp.]